MTDEISSLISSLIDRYIAEVFDDEPRVREVAVADRVLPLYSSMGGFYTVNSSGEVISYLWDDTLHGKVEFDPDIRNSALFQGSKRYPELASLIKKPPDARVCPYCNGSGIPLGTEALKTDSIICYCGGLGWLS